MNLWYFNFILIVDGIVFFCFILLIKRSWFSFLLSIMRFYLLQQIYQWNEILPRGYTEEALFYLILNLATWVFSIGVNDLRLIRLIIPNIVRGMKNSPGASTSSLHKLYFLNFICYKPNNLESNLQRVRGVP